MKKSKSKKTTSQNKQKEIVMKKSKSKKYGIFYRSNGRWTATPYAGFTFTKKQWERPSLKKDIKEVKNKILKSRIKILLVK